MALQFRRGTDAERQQFEFAEGEPVYVTDTGELYIGDGETQGGRRVLSSLSEESDPALGGNLDLNSNNIIGIGNIAIDGNLSVSGLGQSLDLNGYNIIGQGSINIDGTINATGDINLGDGAEDNVIVGGQISSPLVPAEDGLYDLGSDSLRWSDLYTDNAYVSSSITINDILKEDSSLLYDSDSDTFSSQNILTSSITSDGILNLGTDENDILLIQGSIDSDLLPNSQNLLNIGSVINPWNNGFFDILNTGLLNSDDISLRNITKLDSSYLYDGVTDTISSRNIVASTLSITGSVEVDGEISADTVSVTRIINQDSTTAFDGISFFGKDQYLEMILHH
jgi:hypothetical protein